MKVRPKHMACISVGSLHLAIKQLGVEAIDTEDLVAISQVSCLFFLNFKFIFLSIYSSVLRHTHDTKNKKKLWKKTILCSDVVLYSL